MQQTVDPELVRISILGTSVDGVQRQLDVALPFGTPIAALMPDVLSHLRIPDPPTDDPALIGELPRWTLATVGGPPMPPEESLSDRGVHDGDLLVIHRDLPTAPGAMVDDVVDGLAHLNRTGSAAWSARSARRLGNAVFVAAVVLAAVVARVAPTTVAVIAVAVGAGLLVAAAIVACRLGGEAATVSALSAGACVASTVAGSFIPAMAGSVDAAGPAALAAAGACGATSALLVHRCTGVGHRLHSSLVTAGGLLGVAGLGGMLVPGGLSSGIAIAAATGAFVAALAGRVAITASRLPLPPVPSTPPGPADPERDAALEGVDAVPASPDPIDKIAGLALVDMEVLTRRAGIAADYLTGILAGAGAATFAAVAGVAAAFGGSSVAGVFGGAVSVALLARGRTHLDALQSGILLSAGAAGLLVTLCGAGSTDAAFFGVIGVGVVALVLGTVATGHEFSPLQRRTGEVVELAVIVMIIPLLLWLLDVYRLVREL